MENNKKLILIVDGVEIECNQNSTISVPEVYKGGFIEFLKLTLEMRLRNLQDEKLPFYDEWEQGVKFGREDMIEEVLRMIQSKETKE